jgi:murein DD-endopeptidase MepM/ murein hydrolase activator NlpD
MRKSFKFLFSVVIVAALVIGYYLLRNPMSVGRSARVVQWIRDPSAHPEWGATAKQSCASAPFILPSDGFIGYLWDDSFKVGHRHQGIDIFGGKQPGLTPVYSAYDGYLTRLSDWKSSVIIRIPKDPLQPYRQIWTYYTHMADANGNSYISVNFPPGTTDMWIPAGTLLGYQGNYSGDPDQPVGVHLHFSIVLDDGNGKFENELEISNTADPSPYFGMNLNAKENLNDIVSCTSAN